MLFKKKQSEQNQGLGRNRQRGGLPVPGGQPARPLSSQPRRTASSAQPADGLRQRQPAAAQSQAFSYYAARSQSEVNLGREAIQNKPKLRRLPGRMQRLRKHAGWLALGILAIGLLVYQLQLSSDAKVVVLSASSETPFLQETSVYQQAARKLFDDSAANRNKLTVDSTAVAAKLEAAYPELQEVSASLPLFGDRPVVYIRPAAPALVLAANNGTFIIDENGRALAAVSAENNPERLQIPTVTDQSSLAVRLGDQVLPSTVTGFISTIVGQLKAKQLEVQSMTLPAAAGELDVYISGQPYYVKFSIQQAGQKEGLRQIGTYLAVKKQFDGNGFKPAQYIDVRLGGRAYYL